MSARLILTYAANSIASILRALKPILSKWMQLNIRNSKMPRQLLVYDAQELLYCLDIELRRISKSESLRTRLRDLWLSEKLWSINCLPVDGPMVYDIPIRQRSRVSNLPVYLDSLLFCLLYTSPSPRDRQKSRMPSSA